MDETAFAKINLALHVRARDPDGYHRIETVFAFAERGDRLTAEPAAGLSLSVGGPFGAVLGTGEDNLVMRAAAALRTRFGVTGGAAIHLDKQLPVASGIGGGSADAAAALRLLNRLWGLGATSEVLLDIAATLGADVPACLLSRTLRGEGRGDRLIPFDSALDGMALLLVNPLVPVSTAAVFAGWDGVDRGALDVADPHGGRNDLTAPAVALAPVIGTILDRLRGMEDVILSRMSGSGATCFALFTSDAARDRAQAVLVERHPDWWVWSSRLR